MSITELIANSGNGFLNTGVNWNAVWTRDTSMAVQESLGLIVPGISRDSLKTKINGDKVNPSNPLNPALITQDTGTGGSYPNSVDRIIMMLAVWEQYLATNDLEYLSYMYDVAKNTVAQDDHVVFDTETGLYRGETGGMDWRAQTYPAWMSRTETGMINIAESKASIVNMTYAAVLKQLARAADILGKGKAEADRWQAKSDALVEAINRELWLPERHAYTLFQYPNYMGGVNADKFDVVANAYAIIYGIAPDDRAEEILANWPVGTYGSQTVWPQKNASTTVADDNKIYHNKGVWPGWQVTMMQAAKERGYNELADHIWKANIRNAIMSLSNKEVVNFGTGAGVDSDRQLWSISGTLEGYYRVLFGMSYAEDGISFAPYVGDWLSGPITINNYPYREAALSISVSGNGGVLTSVKFDGADMPLNWKLPANVTGSHTIELTVTSGGSARPLNIGPMSYVVCPPLPVMSYSNGVLSWTSDARFSYKLWNGNEFIPVEGGSYTVDTSKPYQVFSLVAVAASGITSEMSVPIIVSGAGSQQTIQAESGQFNGNAVTSGGVTYVADNYNNWANLSFDVTVDKPGVYYLNARYANGGSAANTRSDCGIRSVYVDGVDVGTMILPRIDQTYNRSSYVKLILSAGTHTIKVFYDQSNFYDRNMSQGVDTGTSLRNNVNYDYFTLQYAGDFMVKPSVSYSDGKAEASFAVKNTTGDPQSVLCILAIYDSAGRMVKVEETVHIVAALTSQTYYPLSADLPQGYSAKAFALNPVTYIPYCGAATVYN